MALKKYIKFDAENGYLDNKDDINYFATSQMRHVAFGNMLGDFDENGLYVINKKLVEELIAMPKVIVEIMEDTDLIRSKVKADTFFHFILTVEDNKASLKLLEKIHHQSNRNFNSGVYSDINEYVLDEVTVPDKDFDRNVLYEKYNISTENDGEALSIFDMDEISIALYYNLIHKLKINYLSQNALILKEKELEAIEADYFESVLEVLGEFGEYGTTVRNAVQDNLAEKHSFMIISKPFFQQTINEVLDSCINHYMHLLSPEQKESFLAKIREIKANYYEKFKQIIPVELAVKSGVRFDANQIMEESIIGSLAKEIGSKGFTSSDVRRIIINDDELQLTIAKLKEIFAENAEASKRDNAKADDITKGRKLTGEFYDELSAKKKTDMLSPDTTLIKSAIDEKAVKIDNQTKKPEATVSAGKTQGGKTTGGNTTGGRTSGGKTSGGKTAGGKTSGKGSGGRGAGGSGKTNPTKANNNKNQENNSTKEIFKFIYGSGGIITSQTTPVKPEEPKRNSKLDRLHDLRSEARLGSSNNLDVQNGDKVSRNRDTIQL